MSIDWHFPRTELAETFLNNFELGIANALTLFAPRRMGKTEFLLQDLLPLAEARGYKVLYVSFWHFHDSPERSLLAGLNEVMTARSVRERIKNLTNTHISNLSLKVSTSGVEGGLTVGAKDKQQPLLEDINQKLSRLVASNQKILLLLDEVQHLATDRRFESLVFFLRTTIDQNRAKVRVVYTGSSRDGLHRLFNRRKAALFHSSQHVNLPDMGSPFVNHMLNIYQTATGRHFNLSQGLSVLRTLNHSPFHFVEVLRRMILSGRNDILQVAEEYQLEIEDLDSYQDVWDKLKLIDRVVLEQIARDGRGLYQQEARQNIANKIGLDEVPAHTIQNSVNRLRKLGYLSGVEQGVWEIEDPAMQKWILHREDNPSA